MPKIILSVAFLFFSILGFSNPDSLLIRKIFDQALENGKSYDNLRVLCKTVGHRISGSPSADKAVQWGYELMKSMQLDSVYLQKVMVPQWVRGKKEDAFLISGKTSQKLHVFSLGGSIGTNGKIKAEVILANSLEDLENLDKEAIKGKIVLFNKALDPKNITTFSSYGQCVGQRWGGASQAAKYGAVASLNRSLTTLHNHDPHTGSMSYKDGIPKIPAAAISTADADLIADKIRKGEKVFITLEMDCQTLPDKESYNVIGELRGIKNPEKIIVVGGHLDSWDKGEAAHDDGAGVVQSIEVLRIFKTLGIKTNYTIRAVLFMNEENGNRGGLTYALQAKLKQEVHIAALESDAGGFSPRGFGFECNETQINKISSWKGILEPYGLHWFRQSHSGTDIGPLKKEENLVNTDIILSGLVVDSQRYFDYHHTDRDVFEAVNQRELELGGASMGALVYLLDKSF